MNLFRVQTRCGVRRISVLLLLLFFSACVRLPAPPAPPTALPDPAVLLARLADLDDRFVSLSALARTQVVRDNRNRSVLQALLVRKPDRLRIDVLGPFSYPLLQIAAAGELQVHIPGEGRFYAGEASVANLARFTGLPLRIEQLVGILLLAPPRFPYIEAASAWRDGAIVLTLDDGDRMRQEFVFAAAGELLQAVYWREGELFCEVRYGDYAAVDAFPRQIALRLPATGMEATLSLTEVETSRPLDEARFRLKPPAQTPILPFPEG